MYTIRGNGKIDDAENWLQFTGSFEEEVKLDTYYIENWSLLLDLSILLHTPMAVFKNRKVE